MRAWSLLVSVAGLFPARGQTTSSDPSNFTCNQIIDPASPFRPFLLELTSMESLFNAERLLPTLWSFCIGSNCEASAPGLLHWLWKTNESTPVLREWLKNGTATTTRPARSLTAASDWLNITERDIASFCTPVAHGLVPCLTNYLFPELLKLLTANPCCHVMAQDSQGKYQEARVWFFGAANQTCGSAWHQSLSYKSADGNVTLDRIRTAMQIPNDQGCAAVLGDAITTTKGQSPVDTFLAWIRQVPFVDTVTWNGVRFRDLFLDGTCVNGTTINRAMAAGFAKSDVDLFYRLMEMTPDDVASMCISVRRFPLPLNLQ
ncbi:hypothetical protein Ae201684P_017577 [Aphanomyces euteiches]|nr:hypothetical protein Ae201684P_017577 [Aphanomyces euteiches]